MEKHFLTKSNFLILGLVLLAVIGASSTLPLMTKFSIFVMMAFPITILSFWLMQQTVRIFSIWRMTIPGFWYLSYLVMIFVPAFYVAAGKPDGPAKMNYLLAVISVLLTAPLGILSANIIFRFKRVEIKRYFAAPVKKRVLSDHLVLAYLIFLLGALGLTVLYVVEAGTIPLFYLIGNVGAYEEVQSLRETAFKLSGSRFIYIYSVLRQIGYPFLIMLGLGNYLVTRRLKWFFLFLAALGSGILYAAFAVAKSPVAMILLTLSLFLYLYFGKAMKVTQLILSVVIIFAFPIGVILLSQPQVGFLVALRAIVLRLFDDPARQLYSYFEVTPHYLDYLYGATISIVARLQGQSPFNLTNYVALFDNPALRERGLTSASANAAFIGDLHANFGLIGVLAGGVLAGFLMQSMQIYLLRQPKTIINLTIYAFLMFGFLFINLTALQTMLLSGGIIFAFILGWGVKVSEAFLKDSVSTALPRHHSVSGSQ